eukprot:3459555-Pyramimonas_sp.AAC.1
MMNNKEYMINRRHAQSGLELLQNEQSQSSAAKREDRVAWQVQPVLPNGVALDAQAISSALQIHLVALEKCTPALLVQLVAPGQLARQTLGNGPSTRARESTSASTERGDP